jgi:hypothetical protein
MSRARPASEIISEKFLGDRCPLQDLGGEILRSLDAAYKCADGAIDDIGCDKFRVLFASANTIAIGVRVLEIVGVVTLAEPATAAPHHATGPRQTSLPRAARPIDALAFRLVSSSQASAPR